MNYLVIGGAGFIGSHLVERLLKEGNVTVLDNFYEGKMSNLPKHPNLNVQTMDITYKDYGKFFKDIDVVFHLAALTRPQESIDDPEKYNDVNIGGTVKIYMYAKKYGVKRIVFVSSSSAYGEAPCPTPETTPLRPMCPYALQKAVGERYAKLFEELFGMQINYIRPFNVYGPRQNPKSPYSAAIPKFIETLARGRTPYITGDGKQARDFIYVSDCVEIIYLASKCKEYGEAFNAGSGTNISINKLYKMICKLMDMDVIPDYIEKVIEPDQTLADMRKVKKILNFEPQVSLEEGIRRTIYGTFSNNS
jgi:nucleoside-diphosphate-sugar epimerase